MGVEFVPAYSVEGDRVGAMPLYATTHTRHVALEKRYNSLRDLLEDFCARTSSHGIPHIGGPFPSSPVLQLPLTAVLVLLLRVGDADGEAVLVNGLRELLHHLCLPDPLHHSPLPPVRDHRGDGAQV